MHRLSVRTGMAAAVAFAFLQLSGCSGDSSGSTSSGSSTVATTSVSGTVATGGPLVGATVTLTDSTGTQATTTTDTNGAYTIAVKGMSAPFLIVATDARGISAPLSAVLAQLPSKATATVNVTTLTTALAAMLTASGNPTDLATTATLAAVTLPSVQIATITLDTILAKIFTQNGVTSTGFDPVSTAFTPNHTGVDAVIDTVSVVRAANGTSLMLVSNAAPATTIALNSKTTSSVTLAAPSVAANYLEPLASLLTACAANGALSTSCSPAIDSAFVENGSTDLAIGHGSTEAAFTGAVFGSPKTLAFFTSNSKQLALVQLPFTLASGTSGVLYTIAQPLATPVTLASGGQLTWDLIGNQSQFAAAISSQIQRRTFLDTKLSDVNRYESGLAISIPTASNPTVYSASVTGPGLASPVWLMPRIALGAGTLGLSDTALSTAPVSPATTTSNTELYRWSWESLSTTASFTAPTNGSYAAQAVDASTVPLYSSYVVTFYDRNGAQLGQSSIINPGSPLNAVAGSTVEWPTLLSDIATEFLTPTGSLAGTQYAMSLTWSSLVNGADIAYPVTSVQIQASAVATGGSTSQVDGFFVGQPNNTTTGQYQATVSAGVNSQGVQSCTNCPFPALTSGGSRIVQLGGGQYGVAYYDMTQYND